MTKRTARGLVVLVVGVRRLGSGRSRVGMAITVGAGEARRQQHVHCQQSDQSVHGAKVKRVYVQPVVINKKYNVRTYQMTTTRIKTYSGESFRNNYIQPELPESRLLKTDFGKFFVIKLEDMTRLMKLPVPPTRITNHTLIYLTEGEAVMTIGSETYKIGPGNCLVVPAGQVFSFATVDRNRGYLCNFHNDFIIGKFGRAELLKNFEFLRVWGNPRISLDDQTSAFVAQLFSRLLDWYSAHGLTRPDISQSYFIALLCELNERYEPVSASGQTTAVTITNRFRELLFDNIKTHHRVADYASLLTVTPNHLNKSVRAITGKSPIKWIDEAIVLEAKVLLYQTNGSISDVAAEVGIADSSYFSRLFKKYEGVTPLAFRKMIEIA